MIPNTLIQLRSSYENKQGESPVVVRLNQKISGRKPKVTSISLGIFVNPKNWSEKKCRVKSTDQKYIEKNKSILFAENRISTIKADYQHSGKLLSINEFKRLFRDEKLYLKTFIEYARAKLTEKENGGLAQATVKGYRSQLKKFDEFLPNAEFFEITRQTVEDYKSYLLNDAPNQNGGKGQKKNTVNKSMKVLREFMEEARKDEIVDKNPFDLVKTPSEKTNREPLQEYEVKRLQELYDSDTKMTMTRKNVLRAFLFACYTGINYNDLRELTFKSVKTKEHKGKKVLLIHDKRTKSKIVYKVPLFHNAFRLLPTKFFSNQRILSMPTIHTANKHLKQIACLCKIEKPMPVTSHIARYTFASLCVSRGVDLPVVKEYMGHSRIATTADIYAKISDDAIFREAEKFKM